KRAADEQDLAIIARDAHSLKGACATYGAPRLAMVCKVAENAAKDSDWETINELMEVLDAEYEKVFEAISNLSVS
ncbi:MAG: hypothetical protein DRH76_11320, partial [Deltaproteobacteria bacterium]